ncbi:hypothetical protein BX666DRAFT_1368276 [Dichotomocladium elegans]|nr:hypothetical protein BX666DRAFT_1368276 [Dichotomocladium elegans]
MGLRFGCTRAGLPSWLRRGAFVFVCVFRCFPLTLLSLVLSLVPRGPSSFLPPTLPPSTLNSSGSFLSSFFCHCYRNGTPTYHRAKLKSKIGADIFCCLTGMHAKFIFENKGIPPWKCNVGSSPRIQNFSRIMYDSDDQNR